MAVREYTEETEAPAVESRVREYTGEFEQPAPPPTPKTKRNELARQLGLTVRHGITGLTGLGGAIADFGVGAANLLPGVDLPMPSKEQQKMLTRLGLPEPEGALENIVGFGATALAGGLDPGVVGAARLASKVGAPAGFRPPQSTAKADVVQELHRSGFKLPPSAMEGGKLSTTVEGVGGRSQVAAGMRNANQPVAQQIAARETGLHPESITAKALKTASDQVYKEGYEPIKQLGTLRLYGNSKYSHFRKSLEAIGKKYGTIDQSGRIKGRINQLKIREMDADDILERISAIRSDAKDAFNNKQTNYGRALREIADTLENQIERNLPANSPLLRNYQAARVQLAKNNAVEEMLVDPKSGLVSTKKAFALRERGEKLTGGLDTLADAGSEAFVHATDAPVKGSTLPLNLGESLYTGGLFGGTGTLGWMVGGPFGGAAAGAGALVARLGSRAILKAPGVQESLATRMMGQPSIYGPMLDRAMAGATPPLAEYAKGLFPTFSQGDQ